MITVELYETAEAWDALVEEFAGHPLQHWGWGTVKGKHGWQAHRLAVLDHGKTIGGAQVLSKRLPWPFPPFVYLPRGPFGKLVTDARYRQTLVEEVRRLYRPLVISAEPDLEGRITWKGWRQAKHRILLARTAILDLRPTEDELLAGMSKKTRQYIRKSAKEGTVVRRATAPEDIEACLAIYKLTAARAGFALHGDDYYQDIFKELGEYSPVYLAEHDGEVVAFLWPLVANKTAFELYGGMNDRGQAIRANYFLKWSVIQEMRQRGVERYDVNGLLNDGVTAFKKGFIPEETMMVGTIDKPLSPLYSLWVYGLPLAKRLVRLLRRR